MSSKKTSKTTGKNRTAVGRYDPELLKALRVEIAKSPNPDLVRMVGKGRMSHGDLLDFALHIAHDYFSEELLEPHKAEAHRVKDLNMRRMVLVTAAIFGMTATFEKEGMLLTPAWTDDPNTHIAAVQKMVDTGMTVKRAMDAFSTGPPKHGYTAESIYTQLPKV